MTWTSASSENGWSPHVSSSGRPLSGPAVGRRHMTTIRRPASNPEVEAAFRRLIGEQCWAIIGGPGTGTVILLDLGRKSLREHALCNPALADEERRFESESSIHVWCSWRVEERGRVVGSSMALPEEGRWERSGL